MAKISVIIGAYNCDETLNEAFDSLLNQTFKDFNIVICDDGSTDNTLNILKKYKKKYPNMIKLLVNTVNKGLNYTLNRCLQHADGKFIARMDTDDISFPNRFEIQNDFLDNNPEISFVSSNMIHFDETGDWGISKTIKQPSKEDIAKGTGVFPHAPVMIRKEAYVAVNGYTESEYLLRAEDYNLWVKLYASGFRGYNIQTPLYKMRDDHNAYDRRNFKNRRNSMFARIDAVKKLNLPAWYYIYSLRPILVGILPRRVYKYFHQKKLSNNNI